MEDRKLQTGTLTLIHHVTLDQVLNLFEPRFSLL